MVHWQSVHDLLSSFFSSPAVELSSSWSWSMSSSSFRLCTIGNTNEYQSDESVIANGWNFFFSSSLHFAVRCLWRLLWLSSVTTSSWMWMSVCVCVGVGICLCVLLGWCSVLRIVNFDYRPVKCNMRNFIANREIWHSRHNFTLYFFLASLKKRQIVCQVDALWLIRAVKWIECFSSDSSSLSHWFSVGLPLFGHGSMIKCGAAHVMWLYFGVHHHFTLNRAHAHSLVCV